MQLRRWVSNARATFKTRRWSRVHRAPMRAGRPRTHAGRTPAHPCGQDARAPMRARCPRTHAGRTPVHPCGQDARAPMRARCPRTHAGGTPVHPRGRDARVPMRARCPRTHAGRMPVRPCGQDARAPMRARCPRTLAARGSIILDCAVCDVLFGWRVAPEASCTDTEGCVFQSTGDSGATASYPALRRRGRRRGR